MKINLTGRKTQQQERAKFDMTMKTRNFFHAKPQLKNNPKTRFTDHLIFFAGEF
jgi:hypothetical protein